MATNEQVDRILKKFKEVHSSKFLRTADKNKKGMGAVLRILFNTTETVTAGLLSERLGISTARVAVLIKKMVDKGFVTKENSDIDARITVVKLTDLGRETVIKMETHLRHQLALVIDAIGEERLNETFDTLKEIQEIMMPPIVLF